MLEQIKSLSSQYYADTVNIRRHLHQNPELSFQEFKTSEFVWNQLESIGITNKKKIAGTGIVALIEGKNSGKKTIALRADMDALPIQELNETPYRSVNAGVMHACGHDVHTSSLLGVARILNELKDHFEGTVKLLFQPGEEKLPGGASMMIKEGVLENPSPSAVLGQHVLPMIDAGMVGFREGIYMASTDEIYVKIKGKGGHGAMPHFNIDPVVAASNMIVALQQIVSRNANPAMPSVLSFGKVIANGATNVIPDEVYLEGTFRTMDEAWRDDAHKKIKHMAQSVISASGATCEFEIRRGYPALINNPALTREAKAGAVEYLGKDKVVDLDIWMAAEDFAFFSQKANACFYRLGTRNESRGITSSVHTPTFDVEEKSLETGIGLMSWLTVRLLA